MVALPVQVDASTAVGAPEFVQVARRDVAREAAGLVGAVAAVEESVALLLGRHADPARTLVVRLLAVAVHWRRERRPNQNQTKHFIH